jgi:uncharacterized protein
MPPGKMEATMNEQNVQTVRRGYEAFGRGDIEGLLQILDESIRWVTPGPPEVPTSGTRVGRQQVAEFFMRVDETLAIQRFEPRMFLADGDHVVVVGDDTAQVKATGKVLDSAWVHVFTLKNGKVVDFAEYMDVSALAAELRAAQALR